MPDLQPLTALGASSARTETFGPLTLCETSKIALASLAASRGDKMTEAMGIALPQAGGWVGHDGVGVFWTGPGQWMFEAQGRPCDVFARALSSSVSGGAVTDQSDAWVVIEVSSADDAGPLVAFLEKLVNIDVSQFGPGRATRTLLAHMSVFLVRRRGDQIAVIGGRSTAQSLWEQLATEAARAAQS